MCQTMLPVSQEWNELHHLQASLRGRPSALNPAVPNDGLRLTANCGAHQIMESLGGDELWVDRFIAQHAAIVCVPCLPTSLLHPPRSGSVHARLSAGSRCFIPACRYYWILLALFWFDPDTVCAYAAAAT
jgi:hypothetical protein